MSIEVEPCESPDSWDSIVDRTAVTTPFHRYAALEAYAAHTGTALHTLVGYKGQEPVGLFPVFELRKGLFSAAFSPPPSREISYLGPAPIHHPNAKQRKRERTHRRFIERTLEYVDDEIGPRYVNVRTSPAYDDPRPFLWNRFDPTPRYTYHVDLTRPPEEILADASSDLRSNVRGTDPDAFDIRPAGESGMHRIVQHAQERHAEQDVSYGVTSAFVRDLAAALPDRIGSYVCTVDDEFVGGTIVLVGDDVVYRWQSVVDFESPVPAQDLLDWYVIRRGIERGCRHYDLVGANDPRLCGYKAKFAPEVTTYYELEQSGVVSNLLAEAYRRFR